MRDFTREGRAQRERLEKMSPRGEGRADVVGMVNGLGTRHGRQELPGMAAYGLLRMVQKGHAAQIRAHNKAHDAWFMRLFGKAAAEPDRAGNDDARDERHTPELRAMRVRDAAGAIYGDGAAHGEVRADGPGNVPERGSDHWGSGKVSDAMEVLSAEDMKHIASMRWRGRFF